MYWYAHACTLQLVLRGGDVKYSDHVAICGGTCIYTRICVTVLIVGFHYVIKVDAKISTAYCHLWIQLHVISRGESNTKSSHIPDWVHVKRSKQFRELITYVLAKPTRIHKSIPVLSWPSSLTKLPSSIHVCKCMEYLHQLLENAT